MTATQLTVAGLAIALTIFALNLRAWWRAGKTPKAAGPYISGLAVGSLMAACAGGVLRWIATLGAGGTNTVGALATGDVAATSEALPVAQHSGLTPGGAIVVVIVSILAAVAIKAASKAVTWRLVGGILTGVSLAATAGAAGWLDGTLYAAANGIGDAIIDFFRGES